MKIIKDFIYTIKKVGLFSAILLYIDKLGIYRLKDEKYLK